MGKNVGKSWVILDGFWKPQSPANDDDMFCVYLIWQIIFRSLAMLKAYESS